MGKDLSGLNGIAQVLDKKKGFWTGTTRKK